MQAPHSQKIALFQRLIADDLSVDEQVAILQQLPLQNVTGATLAALAEILLAHAQHLNVPAGNTVDLVGTGGDHSHTFNISTTAAFIVAGAGIPIAKHGNRSVTSRSGCFDCLEALDIPRAENSAAALQQLQQYGITFLLAPYFHPIMKKIMPARHLLAKQGHKSVFNLLGPLINPAQLKRMAIGVFQPELIEPFVQALQHLHVTKALVFHGNGLDEFSLTGTTHYAVLENQTISFKEITPEQLGLQRCTLAELHGGDAATNAQITLAILQGKEQGPKRDIALLNAAAAIQTGYKSEISLMEAIDIARQAVDNGEAFAKLQNLRGKDQ